MNHAYKLVWNTAQQAWTVASELAKGKTKSSAKSLRVAIALVAGLGAAGVQAAPAANALPSGESVVTGSATFDRSVTNQLTVNQAGSKLLTNWSSFDVGSSGKVIFAQPDASSIALNRVTTGSPTQIFGQVTANGQLVIVNPNGITFGTGSQVSAASIIGSVLDIQDSDFNTGNLLFNRGSATGGIDNQGSLTATAGSVSLLAPSVKNSGAISATAGHASLINADGVDLSTLDPAVITASSIASLVKNSGSLQATQLSSVGGKILLQGDTSQASSKIELTGALTAEESSVNARQINVAGVLDVDGTNNTLKLNSTTPYNLTVGSKINLNGASSGFSVNGTAYTVIRDVNQLQAMNSNLAGKYVLANDVDASDTVSWSAGAGFAPVGNDSTSFIGVLDGLGHEVEDLVINRPGVYIAGLIGVAQNSLIQNIGVGGSVIGGTTVGGLVGAVISSTVNNSYMSGNVNGNDYVGGLVGYSASSSAINNSYASGNVTGSDNFVGGLLGYNNLSSTVTNSYATGVVTGSKDYVGGLVGISNNSSMVSNSYATGVVTGNGGLVGGLVGYNSVSTVINSYATGLVSSSGSSKGGLIGSNNNGTVTNNYWDSDTTGQANAIGFNSGGAPTNLIAVSGNGGSNPSAYNQGSYVNFDFNNTWFMAEGSSRPMLRALLNTPDADGKIAVSNLYQLQGMVANLAGNYYLTQDLDASATASSVAAGNLASPNRSDVWGGHGFAPVGDNNNFTGNLDGLGHVVSALNINRPTSYSVGLIGLAYNAVIQNIGLSNVHIAGQGQVGGLIGYNYVYDGVSSIRNSFVTGTIVGNYDVGGMIGFNVAYAGASSEIYNSYSTADVIAQSLRVGGLVGMNRASYGGQLSISNSYAAGSVSGDDHVGGLVGYHNAVTGGLAKIENSYSISDVSGQTLNTGGLVGDTFTYDGSISVSNSYWDMDATGQVDAVGDNSGGTLNNLVGLTSSQMKNLSSFANWGSDIDAQGGTGSVWRIYEGQSAPLLRSLLGTANVTVLANKTYDGVAFGGGYTLDFGDANSSKILGSAVFGGAGIGARNAGVYNLTVSGLYSDQQGYDIATGGELTINKANLVISTTDVNKTYNGTTGAIGSAIAAAGTQLFDTDSLTGGTFAFDNKHAGTGKTVSTSAVTVNDGNNGDNYAVTYADNSNSSIDKANLVISTNNVSKTYDGTSSAKGTAVATAGTQVFAGDSLTGGTFAFADKNAGSGKTVRTAAVTVNDSNGGNNYNVSYTDNVNSIINKRLLTISATAVNKVYDGKLTTGTDRPLVTGRQRGDSITGLSQSFLDKNVGSGKTVRVNSGFVVNDGNGGNNYDVVLLADNVNGVITPRTLTISTVANTKVYDGSVKSANKPLVTGLATGDRLTGLYQQYETKLVGENKKMLIKAGYVLKDGNNGANYNVVEQTSTDGVITAH